MLTRTFQQSVHGRYTRWKLFLTGSFARQVGHCFPALFLTDAAAMEASMQLWQKIWPQNVEHGFVNGSMHRGQVKVGSFCGGVGGGGAVLVGPVRDDAIASFL